MRQSETSLSSIGINFSECLLRSFSVWVWSKECIQLPLPLSIFIVHIWGGAVNNKHVSSTERISFASRNPWTKNYSLEREIFGNEHVFLPCAYLKTGYVYIWFELESLLAGYNINYSLLTDKEKGIHRLFFLVLCLSMLSTAFSFQLRSHSSLSCPYAIFHAVVCKERCFWCLLALLN